MKYNKAILKLTAGARTIGISGHIRPDGDCVGAVMGLYRYLKKMLPEAEIDAFLEKPADIFNCLDDVPKIRTDFLTSVDHYDIFFALDTVKERMGEAEKLYDRARKKINIDHHISNSGSGYNSGSNSSGGSGGESSYVDIIDPTVGSTCELLYECMDDAANFDEGIAKALYIGMIHDTGVFQYSNTSPRTLEIAAELIRFGFDFSQLIMDTFYERTYIQNQIMARAILESILFMEGRCIVSALDKRTIDFYGAAAYDMEGIVNQLLITKGVECAIFMVQTGTLEYKVSLRSKGLVDVAQVAAYFGGGGHVRAAGVNMSGTFHDIANNISYHIDKQLNERNLNKAKRDI